METVALWIVTDLMDNPVITPDEELAKSIFFTILTYISSANTDMKRECLEIFCTAKSQ